MRKRSAGASKEEMRLSCVLMNKVMQGAVDAHRHAAMQGCLLE